jgi:rRNA maturation protein Nop10
MNDFEEYEADTAEMDSMEFDCDDGYPKRRRHLKKRRLED